ncbi:MAG: helix-turn-helix transcriptional regulator [Oligoflexus sp.]
MNREKMTAAVIFVSITFIILFDIIHDVQIRTSTEHIIIELILISLSTLGGSYLIRSLLQDMKHQLNATNKIAHQYKKEADSWREQVKALIQGLGQEIDAQFDKWGFSSAEKAVALLLIKGLAIREIAEIRQVKEKTIRQQCLNIYQKAGIKSRPELTAFFLEDLLQPRS